MITKPFYLLHNLCLRVHNKIFLDVYKGKRIIHPSVQIAKRAKVKTNMGGIITIGKNSAIHDFAIILSYGGFIHIGENCSVHSFCVLYGHGGLSIGNGVRIAVSTIIIPANHTFDDINKFIYQQPERKLGIKIEDDVWIGAGVKILDGVTIGQGCVIGAGSVVTKNIESFTIAAGNPARPIRKRGI